MIPCKKRARKRGTQLSREEVKSNIENMFNITTNKKMQIKIDQIFFTD